MLKNPNSQFERRKQFSEMEKNPAKWPLSVLFGFLVILSEITFAFIAYLKWPAQSGKYSIFTNWHSDLGSTFPGHNSLEGSLYHNVGIAIQGFALIMFAAGLYIFSVAEGKNQRVLFLAQAFGMLAGFSFIMAGIYSLDLKEGHNFWASLIFISLVPFIGCLSYLFSQETGAKRWIGIYGFAVVFIDGIFALTFISPVQLYALEFLVIGAFQGFILVVTLQLFCKEVLQLERKTKISTAAQDRDSLAEIDIFQNSKAVKNALETINLSGESPKRKFAGV
ncbi:MAG: hypothetical protein ACXACI_18685 [Candidatus Hodarchaeales archaeon]